MRRPVSLAVRVPAAAIGYVEVADLSRLIEEMGRTRAWREVAPVFGVEGKLAPSGLTGWSGWLAGLTSGSRELALVADAHLGLVLSSVEVSGNEVRPRLALLVETSRDPEMFREPIEKLLQRMAESLPGHVEPREERYAGVVITGYYSRDSSETLPERGLFAARVEGGWIISNHIEPMRSCLDASLGRVPTMAGNFYWLQARRRFGRQSYLTGLVGGDEVGKVDGLFGFVTGDGVTRLFRSGAHILSGGTVASAILAGAAGDVVTDLSSRFCEGVALQEQVDGDGVKSSYMVMLKPDLVDTMRSIILPAGISPTGEPLRSIGLMPPGAREWTAYRLRSPGRTVSGIEAALSARIGVAQSFLLHQFVTGAREAFPGIRDEPLANAALGDELVTAQIGEGADEGVWLFLIRDRVAMSRLVEDYLKSEGRVVLRREMVGGIELLVSGDESRGGAVAIGDFMAIGSPAVLRRLVETQNQASSGSAVAGQPRYGESAPPDANAFIVGYARADEEVLATMLALAGSPTTDQGANRPDLAAEIAAGRRLAADLPYAVRITRLESHGLDIESRSPLGNLPFVVGIITGLNGATDQKGRPDEH